MNPNPETKMKTINVLSADQNGINTDRGNMSWGDAIAGATQDNAALAGVYRAALAAAWKMYPAARSAR